LGNHHFRYSCRVDKPCWVDPRLHSNMLQEFSTTADSDCAATGRHNAASATRRDAASNAGTTSLRNGKTISNAH